MEDEKQILIRGNAPVESETEMAGRTSCSNDQPPSQSTARPIGSTDQAINRSPDHQFTRSTDSERCRECLGAMAHRLAQPMTALRGGIELGLMGKRTAADYHALLEQSLQLADSMVRLIVSMRDLAESGTAAGMPESVSLHFVVEEVLREMESCAQAQNLRLELTADGHSKISADPTRLRDALQHSLGWVIQNCACGGPVEVRLAEASGMARVQITPPRMDLQYLQIKMLDDLSSPGLLFARSAKHGALGWAINHRLWEGLGGTLEMLSDGPGPRCICISLPLA